MSTRSTRTSTSTPTSSSGSPDSLPAPLGLPGRIAAIALMAVGSVAMWLGVPVGLIYAVSQMVETTQPQMGPYMIIVFGVPIGMTIIGKGLSALDRWYGRRTGTLEERRQAVWLRSMRGERKDARAGQWKVLDVVMLWSVMTASILMGIWFLFFAGSPI